MTRRGKTRRFVQYPILIEPWDIQQMYGGQIDEYEERVLSVAIEGVRERHLYGEGGLDMYDLAAVYGFKIARDGQPTKRNEALAIIAVRAFLHTNGAKFEAKNEKEKEVMARVICGKMLEEEFAAWLRGIGRD